VTPIDSDCPVCGRKIKLVRRAANGDRLTLNREPDNIEGIWMILSKGHDRGRAVKLGGPLLQQCRADTELMLYGMHVCGDA
jgi:hypothetical protein